LAELGDGPVQINDARQKSDSGACCLEEFFAMQPVGIMYLYMLFRLKIRNKQNIIIAFQPNIMTCRFCTSLYVVQAQAYPSWTYWVTTVIHFLA
jgi:hypothetical protein